MKIEIVDGNAMLLDLMLEDKELLFAIMSEKLANGESFSDKLMKWYKEYALIRKVSAEITPELSENPSFIDLSKSDTFAKFEREPQKEIEKESDNVSDNVSVKDKLDIKIKNKVTENMHKEVFRFYGKDKQGDEIEYKIDGVSFTDAIEVFVKMYPDVEDWDVETLKEDVDFNNVQWGVHQFSTESIIFRGTEEECQRYIDDRPELWDDAEVYFMTPDDPHYIKPEEKQPLTEAGEEKVYQVIVKYKDEPVQKLEARIAKNRKDLEYQLSTDPDVEWYDFDEKQFNEDKDEKQICCICGKEYVGYGNNAEPVKAGRCCDDCNINKVIPARLLKINVSESKPMIEIFQNLNKIKK